MTPLTAWGGTCATCFEAFRDECPRCAQLGVADVWRLDTKRFERPGIEVYRIEAPDGRRGRVIRFRRVRRRVVDVMERRFRRADEVRNWRFEGPEALVSLESQTTWVQARTPLPSLARQGIAGWRVNEAVRLGAQLFDLLGDFHACGLVHGQIDVNTVRVDAARRQMAVADLPPLLLQGFTSSHAPEMQSGHPATRRTDIFDAAHVLASILSGRPLGGTPLSGGLQQAMGPIAWRREQAPRSLAAILDGCLDRQPRRRPTDAHAVAASLHRWRAENAA